MTDQELDAAVNAAIDTIKNRGHLRDALVLFVASAELARELVGRAIMERPADAADTRQLDKILENELSLARCLRTLMIHHDYADRPS